ncbi:MAG: hypothetical protein LBI78_04180 [Campylobacteraceae bacterium]|nr:hypothetical protein [Campylobacteraceae bacterium]
MSKKLKSAKHHLTQNLSIGLFRVWVHKFFQKQPNSKSEIVALEHSVSKILPVASSYICVAATTIIMNSPHSFLLKFSAFCHRKLICELALSVEILTPSRSI